MSLCSCRYVAILMSLCQDVHTANITTQRPSYVVMPLSLCELEGIGTNTRRALRQETGRLPAVIINN